MPSVAGGASWSGGAIDPETGMFYVGTYRLPFVVSVRKPRPWESSYDFIGEFSYLRGPRGLPLLKPPFGSILAIDMNTGDHKWMVPLGNGDKIRNHPLLKDLKNAVAGELGATRTPEVFVLDKDRVV